MAWGRSKPRGTRVIDRFAEALADCGDVATAAARLGIRRSYADNLLSDIRKQLGPQAI